MRNKISSCVEFIKATKIMYLCADLKKSTHYSNNNKFKPVR